MSGAWLREEQTDLAVDKILEAASRAFVDLGVSRTRMGHIAQYAGCSRGTLYRYFKTRAELDLAYIDRSARCFPYASKANSRESRIRANGSSRAFSWL
jgi:AcrR family transcriptional regulator